MSDALLHHLVWASGAILLLAATRSRLRRRPLALAALWTVVWVELGVTLTFGESLRPTDAESGPSGWDATPSGHALLDAHPVPPGLLASDEQRLLREPGTWRVVLVGDSFTVGQGVSPSSNLAAHLRARLQAALPGVKVEVLNHGFAGFGTWDLESVVRDESAAWSPDVIVWVHVLNDLPNVAHRLAELSGGYDDAIVDRTRDARAPGPWWTYEVVADVVQRRRASRAVEAAYRDGHDPQHAEADLSAFEAALTPLVAAQTARGGRFVVATYPLLVGLDAYPFAEAHGEVLQRARGAGAEGVDLLPAFVGRDAASLWVRPEDHHPNSEGHTLAAEALADAILAGSTEPAAPRDCGDAPPNPDTDDAAALAASAAYLRCAHPSDPMGPYLQARAVWAGRGTPTRIPLHQSALGILALRQAVALDQLRGIASLDAEAVDRLAADLLTLP